jgi:hypothetical protein
MPTYEYHCPVNDKIVSVWHNMSSRITTWGELCEAAGLELEGISAATPVERLISGGQIIGSPNITAAPATRMPCGQTRCGCSHG